MRSAAHCRLIPGLSLSDDIGAAAAVFAGGSAEFFAVGLELHPSAEPSSSPNAAIPTARSKPRLFAFTPNSVICASLGRNASKLLTPSHHAARFRETHVALHARIAHLRGETV